MAVQQYGIPCWVDLATSDVGAAQAFYRGLLGWEYAGVGDEYGDYSLVELGQFKVAGLGSKMGEDVPDAWTIYLRVEDAVESAEQIAAHGGAVMVEPMAIPLMGKMAIAMDPTGAVFGIWEPAPFEGFETMGVPGAPAYFETLSTDADAALAFYRDALGWDVREVPDDTHVRYWTNGDDDDALAGLMDAQEVLEAGMPSFWQWYVRVDDADAAQAKAKELGGSVVRSAEDTPYGRLVTIADTTGAVFNVMGPNVGATDDVGDITTAGSPTLIT